MKEWLARSSKKLWVAIGAALVVLMKDYFGLDEPTAEKLVALSMAYIVGQGVADLGKEKAKVEKAPAPPG
tara:strand:- start:573 stop:782 length:210 start_codon:yes stop_codon:yes gene_type:complete